MSQSLNNQPAHPPRFRSGRGRTRACRGLAVLALAIGCGCSSFQTEWERDTSRFPVVLVDGTTRMETVTGGLGPPARIAALPHGCAFLYEHSVIGEFQVGLSADLPVIRWLKFVHAFNHLDQDVLVLTFDDAGVLRAQGGREWREQLGGGNAAQLVFASISLTDPALRRQQSDQHRWGRSSLQPAPVALNAGENLRTGEHGLQQQRIAPRFAGQHTLEMTKPTARKSKFRKRTLE